MVSDIFVVTVFLKQTFFLLIDNAIFQSFCSHHAIVLQSPKAETETETRKFLSYYDFFMEWTDYFFFQDRLLAGDEKQNSEKQKQQSRKNTNSFQFLSIFIFN
jgi:hypothetical protein